MNDDRREGAGAADPLLSTAAEEAPLFAEVHDQPAPVSEEMMEEVRTSNEASGVPPTEAVADSWVAPDHTGLLHRATEDRELADLLHAADAIEMTVHAPMTHLPPLSAPELKIIGRCVSFCADTSDVPNQEGGELIFYEGLVASLSLSTVVLMHVHRMTEMAYQLRQMEVYEEVEHLTNHLVAASGRAEAAHDVGGCNASAHHIASVAEDVTALRNPATVEHSNVGADVDEDGHHMDDHGVATPVVMADAVLESLLAAPIKQRNRLGNVHECGGPIPFMTFTRSRIHDVVFARDPSSSIFKIFHDPSRHLVDLQCLRMYVRRYLVHCSQGNNPRQVSLRHFMDSRCACEGRVDDDVLLRIARQELRYLVKVARDMKKASDKRRQPRTVEQLMQQYRAPPGLFQRTGILFLTNIPRQTFFIALMELVLVCAWLLYMGITYIAAEALFLLPFLEQMRGATMITAVLCTLTVCFSLYHSTVMRIPMNRFLAKLAMMRGLLLLATMLVCILFVVGSTSDLMQSTVKSFLLQLGSTDAGRHDVCTYYLLHSCSGFDVPCGYASSEDERASLCNCTNPHLQNYMNTCQSSMMSAVQQTMVPMCCMGGLLLLVLGLDFMLLGRMVLVARIVAIRLSGAAREEGMV